MHLSDQLEVLDAFDNVVGALVVVMNEGQELCAVFGRHLVLVEQGRLLMVLFALGEQHRGVDTLLQHGALEDVVVAEGAVDRVGHGRDHERRRLWVGQPLETQVRSHHSLLDVFVSQNQLGHDLEVKVLHPKNNTRGFGRPAPGRPPP